MALLTRYGDFLQVRLNQVMKHTREIYKIGSTKLLHLSVLRQNKKAHSEAVRRKTLNSICRYATFGPFRRNAK